MMNVIWPGKRCPSQYQNLSRRRKWKHFYKVQTMAQLLTLPLKKTEEWRVINTKIPSLNIHNSESWYQLLLSLNSSCKRSNLTSLPLFIPLWGGLSLANMEQSFCGQGYWYKKNLNSTVKFCDWNWQDLKVNEVMGFKINFIKKNCVLKNVYKINDLSANHWNENKKSVCMMATKHLYSCYHTITLSQVHKFARSQFKDYHRTQTMFQLYGYKTVLQTQYITFISWGLP